MKKRDILILVAVVVIALAMILITRPNLIQNIFAPSPTPTAAPVDLPDDTTEPTVSPSADPGQEPSRAPGEEKAAPTLPPAKAYMKIIANATQYPPVPLLMEEDITIKRDDGNENVIHLTPDGFHMVSSTCADQICIQQGEVTLENRDMRVLAGFVICIPNDLQLELLSPEEAQREWQRWVNPDGE